MGDYFSDQDVVFWIVRLLFEPIRLDDRIPPPANAVSLSTAGLRRQQFGHSIRWRSPKVFRSWPVTVLDWAGKPNGLRRTFAGHGSMV